MMKSRQVGMSCTACGHRIAHRKWKEIKLQPGTGGPGNRVGCCLDPVGHPVAAGCKPRDHSDNIPGQTKRFLRGCENFLPALA